MPAKESVLVKLSDNETKFLRKDVDHLVQNIKDNLKLNYEAVSFEKGGVGGGGKTCLPSLDYNTTVPPLSSSTSSRKCKSFLSSARSSRASPYTVPMKMGGAKCDCEDGARRSGGGATSSWAARKRYPSMSANSSQMHDLEDPLEMLHELISEGNLLKEAVRRLQLGLTPKIQKRNFYDSDEDCRTPPGAATTNPTTTSNTFPELCQVGFN